MRASTGRTALYRFYDAAGELLYIGISNDPDARWKSHRYGIAKWPTLVASRKDEWYDSRWAAEEAEVAAIKAERPLFNSSHNFVEVTFTPAIWAHPVVGHRKREVIAKRIRQEISSGGWPPGTRIPNAEKMGAVTRTSKSTATKAMGPLIREGILSLQSGRGVFVEPCAPMDSPWSAQQPERVTTEQSSLRILVSDPVSPAIRVPTASAELAADSLVEQLPRELLVALTQSLVAKLADQ